MKLFSSLTLAALAVALWSSTALAGVIVTQTTAAAPTYTTVLNFDEPGGPTGPNVPINAWNVAPWSIPSFQSGDGSNFVGDNSGATAQGTNSYYGPWGIFINWTPDLTSMSLQVWDPSGPATPFGGGLAVIVMNNGSELYSNLYTPAWAGVGKTWFNITTTAGSVFDEVRILGYGDFPTTIVDNLSWNTTPEPASLVLLASTALAMLRRRRS